MQRFLAGRTFGFALSIGIVASIAFFYRHVLVVNQTTVALTLLLAILAVSAVWGMAVAVFMSLAAMPLTATISSPRRIPARSAGAGRPVRCR